jgi:hypothetical protein
VFGEIVSVETSVASHDAELFVCSCVGVVVEGADGNAFADGLVTVGWLAADCVVAVD